MTFSFWQLLGGDVAVFLLLVVFGIGCDLFFGWLADRPKVSKLLAERRLARAQRVKFWRQI